jgi:NitT/TauT family transport system permease protein
MTGSGIRFETTRVLSIAAFLLVWQIAAVWAASALLPSPLAVADTLWRYLAQGQLGRDVGITLARVGASFVVAMIVGTAIGIAMGRHEPIDRFFDAWLVLGLNIPALVIMILCYVWFGLTELAAIAAVAANKVPVVAVTVREGARALDQELVQVGRVLRLSWRRAFLKITLPQLVPYLMAAARNGLALVWKIVLVVELIGRSNGVGFQLGIYFQLFDIASILAYTAAFVIVVLALEGLILRPLEVRLTGWRDVRA